MADKKISQLTDGTSLQSGDFVVVARSGDNFKVDPTIFDEITATTVDINGGTIDGVTIGGSSAGAITGTTGQFDTSLNVDGTVTADGLTVNNLIPSFVSSPASSITSTGNQLLLQGATNGIGQSIDLIFEQKLTTNLSRPGGKISSIAVNSYTTGNGNTYDSDLVFYSGKDGSDTEIMRITSSGGVGIGTTSPGATLDVRGAAIFNESGADADFRVESDTNANMLFVDAGNDRIGIGTGSPATTLDVNGTVTANGLTVDGGDVAFYEDTGTDQRFYWDASREQLIVGFNEDPADAKISLRTTNYDPTVEGGKNAQGLSIRGGANGEGNYSGAVTFSLNAGGANAGSSAIAGVMEHPTSDDKMGLVFFTHPSTTSTEPAYERMRINADGDVGIGTSSPAARLDVRGAATFNEGGGDVDFRVESDTRTHALFVQGSDSNVGIGTSAPDANLHIADSSGPELRLENTDTALAEGQVVGSLVFEQNDDSASGTGITGRIQMRSADRPDNGIYFGNVADMDFLVSGSSSGAASDNATKTAMTIRAGTGRVGIGTTSPSQALDVIGNIEVSGGVYLGGTGAANRLDDYEEGTWTPVLTGLTSGTYTFAGNNTYTKVGNQVTVWAEAAANNATANFGTLSGTASITGLPFTPAVDSTATIYYFDYSGTGTPYALIINGATGINIRKLEATTSNNSVDAGDIDGTNNIRLCITYQV